MGILILMTIDYKNCLVLPSELLFFYYQIEAFLYFNFNNIYVKVQS